MLIGDNFYSRMMTTLGFARYVRWNFKLNCINSNKSAKGSITNCWLKAMKISQNLHRHKSVDKHDPFTTPAVPNFPQIKQQTPLKVWDEFPDINLHLVLIVITHLTIYSWLTRIVFVELVNWILLCETTMMDPRVCRSQIKAPTHSSIS